MRRGDATANWPDPPPDSALRQALVAAEKLLGRIMIYTIEERENEVQLRIGDFRISVDQDDSMAALLAFDAAAREAHALITEALQRGEK